MNKILTRLVIHLICGSYNKTNKILDIIYGEEKPVRKVYEPRVVEVKKTKSKKEELVDNLTYLKSKKTKTKQDKESIYTLEMVLKNMK